MDKPEAYFEINSSMTFDSGNTTGNLSEFLLNLSEGERKCLMGRKYWAFIDFSIVSYGVILLIIWCWPGDTDSCHKVRHRRVVTRTGQELTPEPEMQHVEETEAQQQYRRYLREAWATHGGYLASANIWPPGIAQWIVKTFIVLLCLAIIGSVVTYFVDISKDHFLIETCAPLSQSLTQQIDLGFNIFFLAFFVKRLLDAPNKVSLMFDFSTLLDFFLIPPSFLAIFMERSWIGIRCCASLRLMRIPMFLFNLNIIKSNTVYIVMRYFAIYFTPIPFYAGMIHLCENMGDPWTEFENAHHLSYLECLYSVIVAFLTVGFKHGYCNTVLGRFILIYMVLTSIALLIFIYVRARQQRRRIAEGSKDEPVNV